MCVDVCVCVCVYVCVVEYQFKKAYFLKKLINFLVLFLLEVAYFPILSQWSSFM